MVKDDVVRKLTEQGFDAYLDGAIIMLRVPVRPSKKDMKKIRDAMKEVKYNSSWGWKIERSDADERNTDK